MCFFRPLLPSSAVVLKTNSLSFMIAMKTGSLTPTSRCRKNLGFPPSPLSTELSLFDLSHSSMGSLTCTTYFSLCGLFSEHFSKTITKKLFNGTLLQYSCLENPMGRGAWWVAVHGVAKSQTRLSDFTFTFHFHALEKEMATHSRVLAWRIPGTGVPGGLPSIGLHRVGHD